MKKHERHIPRLLRPWNDGWQIWKKDPPEEPWALEETRPSIASAPLPPGDWLCAVPARNAVSWAGWIPVEDAALARESASMLLEVNGFTNPATPPDSRILDTLAKINQKTLVRAAVFPADFDVPVDANWKGFLPSPLALPPAPGTLALHREGESLVARLCGMEGVRLWEAHAGIPEPSAARSWVELFLLEAEASELLPELRQITDYTGLLGVEPLFGTPVISAPDRENGPAPALPETLPEWTPPGVSAHREVLVQRKNLRRILSAAGALLGVLAIVAAAAILQSTIQNIRLRAEVSRLESLTAPLAATARDWELLADSIDPKRFALEKLLMAVNALPADGVRLSIFEATPSGVRIEGDARNVGLATLYFNALREEPAAAAYQWEMPPPALQPDNSARFAINGTPSEPAP